MKEKYRILGIDPGTATIGWSVLEYDQSKAQSDHFTACAYGHISTSKDRSDEERLVEIASDLTQIIALHKPDIAAVEQLFFFKNQKTIITVAQSRGVILYICKKSSLEVHSFTPLQIKQALTGYGRASKNQIQLTVQKTLKLAEIPKPDDTADALAVAMTECYTRKSRQARLNALS